MEKKGTMYLSVWSTFGNFVRVVLRLLHEVYYLIQSANADPLGDIYGT